MKQKTLSNIGEFGIIEIIKNRFKNGFSKSIVAGIGDDAFSFKVEKSQKGRKNIFSITKDMLIEDVHFKTDWISPFDLGKKAIEVNISDLAAMGNIEPKYIFIGLGAPQNTTVKFARDFAKGISLACKKYGAQVVGGDTVRADKIIISITAIGISDKIVKREGAKTGDLIGATNFCGDSAAGIDLLYRFGSKYEFNKEQKYLINRHNKPQARLKESAIIANFADSMTDSSDGLYSSVSLLTKTSKKGADIFIDKIPISKQLENVVKDKNKIISYALFGAEDFEIIFTTNPKNADILKTFLPQISFVGQIKTKKSIDFISDGEKIEIYNSGFKHF